MFRLVLYLCVAFALTFSAYGQRQVRTIKPVKRHPAKTDLGIGIGYSSSVLYLARNTSDRNDSRGITGSLVYEGSKLFRVTLEYTRYSKIDIVPTWYGVTANTIETNLHILYRSKGNLFFYPLVGISYNTFKGLYTGLNDYLNLSSVYDKGENVTTRWLGFNAGVGLEYSIKPFIIYGSFKMRVGVSESNNELNILDVCSSIGVRYNLRVPSLYKLFHGTRNRYFLDTDK